MRTPSKRWSTAVVAVAAGHEHCGRAELVQPLGQLATRAVETGERLRLHEVRRHDGCEREEPADERVDSVVLEQLRAGARDHHRVDDERRRMVAR